MERIEPKKVLPALHAEHAHRYVWASRIARGRVLDAACGVGYGAPLLLRGNNVVDYTGIDNSQEAVDFARRDYSSENTSFIRGDIYRLPFADGTFDSVVSLETIEHLEFPAKAIAELARVLKPGGIVLGSVPSAAFETRCVEAYGPNEFHKSIFTLESLQHLLQESFPNLTIWNCWLSVASVLAPLNSDEQGIALEDHTAWGTQLGSLLFAATNGPKNSLPAPGITRVFPAVALVEHEIKTLTPRDTAIRNQTRMIDERDKVIRATEARLEARRLENIAQSKLVDDRDAAIRNQTELIKNRDATITSQARLVEERTAELTRRDEMLTKAAAGLETEQRAHHATADKLTRLQGEFASVMKQLSETREELIRATAGREAAVKAAADQAAADQAEREALSRELAAKIQELKEHETLVHAQSELIAKRTAFIKQLEALIVSRDAAIVAQTKMIDERTALIAAQDRIVEDRNEAIRAQTRLIDERDAAIRTQKSMIAERDAVVLHQHSALKDFESRLGEAASLAHSLQATVAAQNGTISMLEQRLASLGGSLSMVRQELRQHLAEMQKPSFCIKQTTRAMLRLGRTVSANGEELT